MNSAYSHCRTTADLYPASLYMGAAWVQAIFLLLVNSCARGEWCHALAAVHLLLLLQCMGDDRCSRLTCWDILTLTWGLCASVFSMMTEYASTYATSALLKASGLQFTNLSANFSISLSIFCASPGKRNPFKKVLGRKSAESAQIHIQWCRSCTSSIMLRHDLQCFLNIC